MDILDHPEPRGGTLNLLRVLQVPCFEIFIQSVNGYHSAQEWIYRNRWLEPRLFRAVKVYPVVVLSGPRQVGKSTLLCHMPPIAQWRYHSFDDLDVLAQAQRDPEALWAGTHLRVGSASDFEEITASSMLRSTILPPGSLCRKASSAEAPNPQPTYSSSFASLLHSEMSSSARSTWGGVTEKSGPPSSPFSRSHTQAR